MRVHPSDTLAHLRRRAASARAEGEARAWRLRASLPAAAKLLRDAYGATRVVLFGSLARGDVSAWSDVDLAVEGLPPAKYFPALAALMGLFGSPVDLVAIEEAVPSLRDRIAAEGQPL